MVYGDMEYKNKNRLQAHPPNSQLWLALGERNMRREKGERVFLYTVPLFLHQTHRHAPKKEYEKRRMQKTSGLLDTAK